MLFGGPDSIMEIPVRSTEIPAEWNPGFDEFQKKLGYRLALCRLVHPRQVKAVAMIAVSMLWNSEGVLPVYRAYRVAIQISAAVIAVPMDIRKRTPGDWL
jgi:hypothetical protein